MSKSRIVYYLILSSDPDAEHETPKNLFQIAIKETCQSPAILGLVC